MRKLFFASILAAVSANSFAQLNNYKLSDYKLPDYRRSVLDLGFYLNGSAAITDYKQPLTLENPYTNNLLSANSKNFNSRVNIFYSEELNNIKNQFYSSITANLPFSFSDMSDISQDTEELKDVSSNRNLTPSLDLKMNYRWYYQTNAFLELDIYGQYDFFNRKTEENSYADGNKLDHHNACDTRHSSEIEVPVKFGFGRIERVEDARQSVFILDELNKNGKIKGEVSKEKIEKLAAFISALKKKRFYDNRLRTIYEYTAIDSFLNANDLLQNADIDYYAVLSDNWLYARYPSRNSGNRMSFGLIQSYYYDYRKWNNKNYDFVTNPFTQSQQLTVSNDNMYKVSGLVEFISEKPINLKWQNTISTSLKGGIINIDSESSVDQRIIVDTDLNADHQELNYELTTLYAQANFFHTIGFYPNTRTNVSFSYGGTITHIFDGEEKGGIDEMDSSGTGALANASLNAYYYISPKLRLTANVSSYYEWQNPDQHYPVKNFTPDFNLSDLKYYSYTRFPTHNFDIHFNLALTYSIF